MSPEIIHHFAQWFQLSYVEKEKKQAFSMDACIMGFFNIFFMYEVQMNLF